MPVNRILAKKGICMRTIRGAEKVLVLILIGFILCSSSKGVLLRTVISHSISDSSIRNPNDDKDNGVRNKTLVFCIGYFYTYIVLKHDDTKKIEIAEKASRWIYLSLPDFTQ